MKKSYRYYFAALLLFSAITGKDAFSETSVPREYIVKAAFLYNFAKFVEWPADAFAEIRSPIVLGMLGEDPFGSALDSINHKSVGDREIVIQRLEKLADLKKCHMLFISRSEKNDLDSILAQLSGLNILTVSDMDGFALKGGIIGLFTVGNKIRFEINVDSAKRSGLQISSKLLKLAEIVNPSNSGLTESCGFFATLP
ncbi:MAG: YfiR family protein [Desulfobacterales bacterium]|nr:MAG: YfiR family protein [Desulfobacterales bacterium]